MVDSSSPRHGDKASYYTAVCLETGEEEWMELEGNSNGESSVAFLERLRERHGGRLGVIWDNAPAHRGPAMRSYLETPGLNLRLVTCLATARTSTPLRRSGAGQGKRPPETSAWEPKPWCSTGSTTLFSGLCSRKDEMRCRCRTVLQSRAGALLRDSLPDSGHTANAHLTLLDFTQNPGKVMDDITFVRSHWWLVSEGFSLSTANSDVQKLPATLYHRIADSLAYAA